MEWSTLSCKILSVLQQDFDIPPNVILLQISPNTKHNRRDRMLQVCTCSLLRSPKIKNFHSEQVGLVWFFFNRKLLYEIFEKAAESFTEHIFMHLSVKTLIHSIRAPTQHFKFLL